MKQNEVQARLVAHGIRPSVQRIAILDYLVKHNTHPTVEMVYNALVRRIPTLSVTTVYNTLRLFANKGVAQMITIDEHRVCYDGITDPHIHFFCKRCGRVVDILTDRAPDVGDGIIVEGNHVDEAHMYYKGICSECAQKEL